MEFFLSFVAAPFLFVALVATLGILVFAGVASLTFRAVMGVLNAIAAAVMHMSHATGMPFTFSVVILVGLFVGGVAHLRQVPNLRELFRVAKIVVSLCMTSTLIFMTIQGWKYFGFKRAAGTGYLMVVVTVFAAFAVYFLGQAFVHNSRNLSWRRQATGPASDRPFMIW